MPIHTRDRGQAVMLLLACLALIGMVADRCRRARRAHRGPPAGADGGRRCGVGRHDQRTRRCGSAGGGQRRPPGELRRGRRGGHRGGRRGRRARPGAGDGWPLTRARRAVRRRWTRRVLYTSGRGQRREPAFGGSRAAHGAVATSERAGRSAHRGRAEPRRTVEQRDRQRQWIEGPRRDEASGQAEGGEPGQVGERQWHRERQRQRTGRGGQRARWHAGGAWRGEGTEQSAGRTDGRLGSRRGRRSGSCCCSGPQGPGCGDCCWPRLRPLPRRRRPSPMHRVVRPSRRQPTVVGGRWACSAPGRRRSSPPIAIASARHPRPSCR